MLAAVHEANAPGGALLAVNGGVHGGLAVNGGVNGGEPIIGAGATTASHPSDAAAVAAALEVS